MLQDIELLESGSILKGLRFPHKIKKVTQIVITAGQLSCLVDFRMWSLKAPAVALFLPGQVFTRCSRASKKHSRKFRKCLISK